MKRKGSLINAQQSYELLMRWWPDIKAHVTAGHRLYIEIKPETRSLEANARMWAMLTDVSRQVNWHGRHLTPEEWKHCFSASLSKQDVVPGIDGGFVVLGKSTSQMTKREMSDLMELMSAFGAERGVEWTEPAHQKEHA